MTNYGNKILYTKSAYITPVLCADGYYRWCVSTFDTGETFDGDKNEIPFTPEYLASTNLEILENTSEES